jgi:hypothetical protein
MHGRQPPLLTTKQAHLIWGGADARRALKRGENSVRLEGLADVVGAFSANIVATKTARAKQGAFTGVSAPY